MLPFGPEMIVFGVIALLLFGKQLPEVARGLGKSVSEFKRGMRGLESDLSVDHSTSNDYQRPAASADRIEPTAPRFVPPTNEPT